MQQQPDLNKDEKAKVTRSAYTYIHKTVLDKVENLIAGRGD